MSDRVQNIVLILLGLPFLALAVLFILTKESVVQRKAYSGGDFVVYLSENPAGYWFGLLVVLGMGLWLTIGGVRGLMKR